MDPLRNLSRSVRIWIFLISVLLSLILVFNITAINKDKGIGFGNGLDYGLDFAGGTEIWLKLDTNVSPEVMTIEKGILESRLNSMGLKDIPVTVYGDQYIIIKIAKASPEEVRAIEEILKQQANFEQRMDGELAVKGSEISIDLGSGSSGVYSAGKGSGYSWHVNIKLDQNGGCRFGKVAAGKFFGTDNPRNRPVDLFIDRPEGTTLLMTESLHGLLGNTSSSVAGSSKDIYFGDTAVQVIENRSLIPVIIVYPNDMNRTLDEYKRYKVLGFTKTIVAEDESHIPVEDVDKVRDLGIIVQTYPLTDVDRKDPEGWIQNVTGLKTCPRLNFDTQGECVYAAQITGGANTQQEAQAELQQNQIWLTSGNLPAKANIDSESTVPPSLGAQFLNYSLLTGLIGILSVSIVIYLRYKKLFIVVPTIITGFSEIIIILGIASLINWEIDLPAIAGIIAAVGTGVDNQIVITDETIASKSATGKKSASLTERIKRAFFIIFTSAATIIALMLPLMTFVAGMLKGFALTTMLGVFIGVFITRPAYAKTIEELLKGQE
jgi:preprotein translocase subunit SecD